MAFCFDSSLFSKPHIGQTTNIECCGFHQRLGDGQGWGYLEIGDAVEHRGTAQSNAPKPAGHPTWQAMTALRRSSLAEEAVRSAELLGRHW